MAVPIEFLRGILGVLCVFFAHMLGRAAGGVHRGRVRRAKMNAWLVRALLTGFAVSWRSGLDGVTLTVVLVAVLAAMAGFWLELRTRPEQEEIALSLDPQDSPSERQHEDRERGGA